VISLAAGWTLFFKPHLPSGLSESRNIKKQSKANLMKLEEFSPSTKKKKFRNSHDKTKNCAAIDAPFQLSRLGTPRETFHPELPEPESLRSALEIAFYIPSPKYLKMESGFFFCVVFLEVNVRGVLHSVSDLRYD
jgi:hypothetical protein